jgi:uncharacterized coiled-coil protein SlyX
MDWVVVTCAADMHLLRYLLASAACFFQTTGKLVVFTSRRDRHLWHQMPVPAGTRFVYREDFPELGHDDYCNQLYLKLRAHEFVDTEHYLVLDSDFLFVAPCGPEDFFHGGKPVWFHAPWDEQVQRFRAASEEFVGAPIDRTYMRVAQYVYSRKIAGQLARRYDLGRILKNRAVSEHIIYGWFAHEHFADSYHWVDVEHTEIRAAVDMVNQVPPSYCLLDPHVTLDQFDGAKCLQVWSHWDLAESKMREFLQDAHEHWPERPMAIPEATPLFPPIDLLASLKALYAQVSGLYLDGWAKDEVRFAVVDVPAPFRVCLEFEIPQGPVTGTWQAGTNPEQCFAFESGIRTLEAVVEESVEACPVRLRFDAGAGTVGDGGRSLVARLIGLTVAVADAAGHERTVTADPTIEELNARLVARSRMVNELYSRVETLCSRVETLQRAADERLAALEEVSAALAERQSRPTSWS